MATLTGETIASTYTTLLQIAAALDATLRNIEDGDGTVSALQLASGGIGVNGDIYLTSGLRIGDLSTAPEDNTIELEERSTDPGDPAEGNGIIYLDDGGGSSEDGNLMLVRTAAASTDRFILNGLNFTPGYYTSTDWDGDAKDGNVTIDLSAAFGLPAGIKAVSVRMSITDETAGIYAILSIDDTDTLNGVYQNTQVLNTTISVSGIVPCDANGDIYWTQEGELDNVRIIINGFWS